MADIYSREAQRFFDQYQSLSFEQVHGNWLKHLGDSPGFALDVGAGSGRDAAALAARGWEVLAVEPATELRRLGESATTGLSVQWLHDRLPELGQVRAMSYRFNLILVSAVWMHLPPTQRERAFRILTELLAPGGLLVISLRHGPGDGERTFYETSREELEGMARNRALVNLPVAEEQETDQLGREAVQWETLTFRLPDDGTGSLPLLRHIIVNDDKSSSYKLGLLRTLTRIADGVPGMVTRRTDDWVELPLGLVGLYWIKLYQPLILKYNLRQAPGDKGYGFARSDFYALDQVSPMHLRVGQQLQGELAATVLRAIRDAAANILRMPGYYTRWPGSGRPVFEGSQQGTRITTRPVILDRETLSRFGSFRVPALLWDCFSRYACWLEPAINNEWIRLMQSYETRYDTESFYRAMRWEEGYRDTREIRALVEERIQQHQPVHCVWTASNLHRSRYDIDHCFPWSRCNNNDLWNLLPSTQRANSDKGEKLPSAPVLQHARPRIVEWWEKAFMGTRREQQFYTEADAALPMLNGIEDLNAVFDGMVHQRIKLRMNQQLAEWHGLRGPA